ncbi:MAG: hypothetical protein JW915_23670 [Chitinispirillaceae bacterium]|nr:hypothetical protein [Chitinispirillaceae bacterium]
MNLHEYKQAIESILYGLGILSGGIGVKYLINAIKLFILYVMPMIKNTKGHTSEKCAYHDSIDTIVIEIREQSKTIIRIETRIEEFFRLFGKQESINNEIFQRLRDIEKSVGILNDRKETIRKPTK